MAASYFQAPAWGSARSVQDGSPGIQEKLRP